MKTTGRKKQTIINRPKLGLVGGMLVGVIDGDPLGIFWASIRKLIGHNTNWYGHGYNTR